MTATSPAAPLVHAPAGLAFLSIAMNLNLRQVKINGSQTMFITSTGTVLFTSYTTYDRYGYRSMTVLTSFDDLGSVVEVGHIKWNENTENSPSLCVRESLVELRTITQDGSTSTVFLGSDGRFYRWQKVDNVSVLSPEGASFVPISVAHDGMQSISTVNSGASSVVLCVQPTGFHLLHEVVATFMLFEKLCRRTREDYGHKARSVGSLQRGDRILSEVPLTKRSLWTDGKVQHSPPMRTQHRPGFTGHISCIRTPIGDIARSTADLTGELLRRYRYPSAHGGFGDIWKCDWLRDSRVIQVAVKVMRTNLMEGRKGSEIKRVSRELKVWVRLEHECVLPLFGISFDFGSFPAMVCPWLEGGSLNKYLDYHEELPLFTRLRLLSDVADGLHYLHGCGIVHGDLTGSNVLIKDNGRACLSDFGLSRIFMETTGSSYLTSTIRGSVRWAAPELFEVDEEQQVPVYVLPDPQSDIYSFGSTMLQVLTSKIPYHYYKNDAQVLVALSRGLRPARPEEPLIDDVHWEFMQRCWANLSKWPSKDIRPSIEEVVEFLSVATTRCS